MKWQQFLGLLMAAGAVDFQVWRSTGIKFAGCGCTGGCARGPDGEAKKEDAVR